MDPLLVAAFSWKRLDAPPVYDLADFFLPVQRPLSARRAARIGKP
jgi:hypothetical protein